MGLEKVEREMREDRDEKIQREEWERERVDIERREKRGLRH